MGTSVFATCSSCFLSLFFFFFSSRRRHTRCLSDWSSDVCSSDLCGGCRVSLGNVIKFACVDGPEFDGHKVNFDELQDRLSTYREFEQRALACSAENCRAEKQLSTQA